MENSADGDTGSKNDATHSVGAPTETIRAFSAGKFLGDLSLKEITEYCGGSDSDLDHAEASTEKIKKPPAADGAGALFGGYRSLSILYPMFSAAQFLTWA